MEKISQYIESFIDWCGVEQSYLYVGSHLLLVGIALVVAWMAYALCMRLMVPALTKLAGKTKVTWDDILLCPRTLKMCFRMVPVAILCVLLPLIFYRHPDIREVLRRTTLIALIFTVMRLGTTLIDALKNFEYSRNPTLHQYYRTLRGVQKVVVIFVAVIIMIAVGVERSPATLIAGLGATSAVLMLVFKDAITGLVAGIRLTSNNMIQKGDWISVPQAGVNGTVEEITLTTVKVRNFDKTILTITPQTLVDQSFQNWRGMEQSQGRRVKRLVYFDFRSIAPLTPEVRRTLLEKKYFSADEMGENEVNMSLFRRYAERFLETHPEVNAEMMYVARQLEATTTGLPLEFYFFLKEKSWKPYEQQLAGIMEHLYAIAPDFGLRIYQQNFEVKGL